MDRIVVPVSQSPRPDAALQFSTRIAQASSNEHAIIEVLSVGDDLNGRLDAIATGNPFETRGWGAATIERIEPNSFDFLAVADNLDFADPQSVDRARLRLRANPFAG